MLGLLPRSRSLEAAWWPPAGSARSEGEEAGLWPQEPTPDPAGPRGLNLDRRLLSEASCPESWGPQDRASLCSLEGPLAFSVNGDAHTIVCMGSSREERRVKTSLAKRS